MEIAIGLILAMLIFMCISTLKLNKQIKKLKKSQKETNQSILDLIDILNENSAPDVFYHAINQKVNRTDIN